MKKKKKGSPNLAGKAPLQKTTGKPADEGTIAVQSPADKWAAYMAAVEAHGYDSPEAMEAYSVLGPDHRHLADSLRAIGAQAEAEPEDVANEVANEIAPGGALPPEQLCFQYAPMPTDMCRVSPFFPKAKQKVRPRLYIESMSISQNSWGAIYYNGPELTTFEEDVLLAVLALIDVRIQQVQVSETDDGRKTYTYRGPLLPILKLMGYEKFGGTNYKRILYALKLMTSAGLEMQTYYQDSRKKRKVRRITITNMLSFVDWNDKEKILTVTLNPYFYEIYFAGRFSLLDLMERYRLNSPVAKVILRFLQSHRDLAWRGHILTLARAINLDTDRPMFRIRRDLKRGLDELARTGVLTEYRIERDIVTLKRHPRLEARNRRQRLLE